MCKKFLVALLMVTSVTCMRNVTTVSANDASDLQCVEVEGTESENSIMTVYISKIYTSLTIDKNNSATIYCRVSGGAGVTKTSISAVLQKKDGNTWKKVEEWSATSNSDRVSLSKTKQVTSGKTYRIKAIYKAYKGSKCETMTKYSSEKKAS